MKITRNLAPAASGKSFSELEIRTADDRARVMLRNESRTNINSLLQAERGPSTLVSEIEEIIEGTLRAVHLDQNWLDIVLDDGTSVRIEGLGDSLDDVIGPMVNRSVSVRAATYNGRRRLIDIEMNE